MSGKVNEALFDLIQSMSKSEKRYFKLLSSRHTIGDENNYVRLFDYIDKQEMYDEAEINRHFKGEAFLNRFSITKKRLYDHILSALAAFNASTSIEAQLDKMIHSADILFEKSLYDQSRRILRSAEKLASKYEKHETLLRITRKQKRLMETNGYADLSPCKLDDLASVEEKHVESIRLYNKVWKVKSQLFELLSKKGVARSEEEIKQFSKICESLLEYSKIEKASLETRYLYHHSLSAYYYAISDLNNSLQHLTALINLFEEDPKLSTIEANKRLSVYSNAIYVCDKLGLYKQGIRYLSTLKNFAKSVEKNEDLSIKLFSTVSSIELSVFLRQGNFDEASKKIAEIAHQLEVYDNKITPSRRAFLEFKIAVVHMGMGEFSEALKWVNNILNDSQLDKTEDIIGFTQLLDLLIHIELNHANLLPYSLKNTQRFFKTRNRLYHFEKILLSYIGKMIKTDDPFEVETLWEELYKDLDASADDEFQNVALEYFDFKSWAEAKLKRKSFDLVVKERYNSAIRAAS